jgi:hypothetical protein
VIRRQALTQMMAFPPTLREAGVPTVHRLGPYRFFFYSDENRRTNEPPHVHVRSGNGSAKFWLEPVSLHEYRGYTRREAERIRRIVAGSREMLLRRWHEFFDPDLD